jgi:hypothetical protein
VPEKSEFSSISLLLTAYASELKEAKTICGFTTI